MPSDSLDGNTVRIGLCAETKPPREAFMTIVEYQARERRFGKTSEQL